MDSIRRCVNDGGPSSLVRFAAVPQLDVEVELSVAARAALVAWQARPGELLTFVDPQGTCYRARLARLDEDHAACIPFERLPAAMESALRITVCHALPEKERFELVLEKLTELGVARILPMETRHSTTLAERDARQRKSHRWPDVLLRAARQCRRAMLPALGELHSFADALDAVSDCELKLILAGPGAPWSLAEGVGVLRPESVALLVGPEGGFAEKEIVQAQAVGCLPVSLGPRILRTETAAIVAAALLQGRLGDL